MSRDLTFSIFPLFHYSTTPLQSNITTQYGGRSQRVIPSGVHHHLHLHFQLHLHLHLYLYDTSRPISQIANRNSYVADSEQGAMAAMFFADDSSRPRSISICIRLWKGERCSAHDSEMRRYVVCVPSSGIYFTFLRLRKYESFTTTSSHRAQSMTDISSIVDPVRVASCVLYIILWSGSYSMQYSHK